MTGAGHPNAEGTPRPNAEEADRPDAVGTVEGPSPVHVVQPDQGESFWQPVPANGYAEVRISHRRDPRITGLATGIQEIAPGSYIREHVHPAQDELLLFTDGEGEAVIDGTRHPLHAGTTVYVGRGHRHTFINTRGDRPLRMCWVMLPGGEGGLDDFFARIGRPRTPGEPAPEPFPRPDDVAAIEAGTVFAPLGSEPDRPSDGAPMPSVHPAARTGPE